VRAVYLLVLSLTAGGVRGGDFVRADSLALAGRNGEAVSVLLEMVRDREIRDEALFRLVGIHHGAGMEAEGIEMLDSLEDVLEEDLHGWKVSLLDLSGDTRGALEYVGESEPLLSIWISRNAGTVELPRILPVPECIAERAVRAMVCMDGRMNKGQVEQTVADAEYLPFLADEAITELESTLKSEGMWWDRVAARLASFHESVRLETLLARRDFHLASGSVETWERRLGRGGEVAVMAARMLLLLDPARWSRSWRLADALVDGGHPEAADSLASVSRDGVFGLGVRLALLHDAGENGELLELCDSIAGGMFPDSLVARADLYRARAQRAMGMPRSVYCSSYMNFAARHPSHDKACEAAFLAARYNDAERNWSGAADSYLAALRTGSFGGAAAYWRCGFCLYMCGRGARGDSVWTSGLERYPYSAWSDEMLFWRARYAGGKGESGLRERLLETLEEKHPWEFYGLLASIRSGGVELSFEMPETSLSRNPVTAEAVRMTAGGYGTMASEMLYGSEACDEGGRAITLALMGEHRRAIDVLRKLDRRLRSEGTGILPDSLLAFYYPAPYRELTEKVISGMGLPLQLVTGLMKQESGFDRRARSWAGASGLIQLMPGTAGDIARWYDLPRLSGGDFSDPYKSILYGSMYLERQILNFGGSPYLALAAYNAGPGNAARWRESFPPNGNDPELFVEQIPFEETRNYVKKVMANSWVYGEILR